MNARKNNLTRKWSWSVGVLALSVAGAAHAAPLLDFAVTKNGQTIGTIEIDKKLNADGSQGISSDTSFFKVTKTKMNGDVMTLAELETDLGRGKFHWFQIVTSLMPAFPGLTAPFIDPPKGGFGNQWADDVPWYWDTSEKPADNPKEWDNGLLRDNNVVGSKLLYEDFPGGFDPGTKIDFVTFLISDLGGRKYQTYEGFSWRAEIDANGKTVLPNDMFKSEGVAWQASYEQLIRDEFGNNWTRIPAPGAGLLLVLGIAASRRRRAS